MKIEIKNDLEEANPLSDSSLPFLVTFEFRTVLEEERKTGVSKEKPLRAK